MVLQRCVINLRVISYWSQRRWYSRNRNILKLNERGMLQDLFPDTAAVDIQKLLNKSPACVYAGFDPTAPSLHVGNLLVLINLLHWQRAGHNVIALVGGATGLIGDPSGRSTDRAALNRSIVNENIEGISKNIETVFTNHSKYFWSNKYGELAPVRLVNNESWYRDMNVIQFVSDVGRKFRMGTMLRRESVQNRINSEVGMSFAEFTYQIFQSHDWLHLLQKYDCRFQIGGSDQMGNLRAGHDLIARVSNTDVYGITLPLVTTEEGDKFGKSAGNALWLDTEKTSPFALYQYFLRSKDSEVERLLKLFTFYTLGEINEIMRRHEQKPEDRYPQNCLAEQLIKLVHGAEGLKSALRATGAVFSKDIKTLAELTPTEMLEIFVGAPVVNLVLEPGITVKDLGLRAKCFPTESDAMRIIEAGGFYINHQRAGKMEEVVTESAHILPNLVTLLRVGKRNHYIVRWHT